MPSIDSMVTEITKQCIEVVSEQITNRLIGHLGFSGLFINNSNLFITSDDLRSSRFDDDSNNIRAQNNRCDVKIVPGYNTFETKFDIVSGKSLDAAYQLQRWTTDEYPIFSDPRAQVYIVEIALPSMIELQFQIRVKSVELSDAFNLALFSRSLVDGGITDYNDIQFSYGFPDKLLKLLYDIYKMQDDVTAQMTFKDYLTIGSNGAISALINRDRLNGDVEIVIQKTNSKVIGRLEYDGDKHDTEDFNKVSNRYVIDFSYFIQYPRPVFLRTAYPIMVYNKLIKNPLLGKQPSNMSLGEGPQFFQEKSINRYFLEMSNAKIRLDHSYPLVRYPYYDDWQRSPTMYCDINQKYQPIFIGLLSVTINTDNTLTLSVDLLNEVFSLLSEKAVDEIKYTFQNFELDEYAHSTKNDVFRRLGIFDIEIFSNDTIIDFNRITVDENYVLTVSDIKDITKLYRIVISQIRDIRILNRDYIYAILERPDYYKDFLAFHMTYLVENKYVKIITDQFTTKMQAEANFRKIQDPHWTGITSRSIIIHNYVIEINRNR